MPVLPEVASRIVRSARELARTLRRRESSAPRRGPSPTRPGSATRPSRTARRPASRARTGAGGRAACARSCRGPRIPGRDPRLLRSQASVIVRYTTELVLILPTPATLSNWQPPRADRIRHHDPHRRVALPAPHLDSDPLRSRDFAHSGQRRRAPSSGRRPGRGGQSRRRGAPALGRAPHRRDLADPQRPARTARRHRAVRPASATRSTSATSCCGSVSR